jgi:spore germination protein
LNSPPIDQITTVQAVVITINSIFGAGILTLPRTATEKVQTPDAWISVILSGMISIVIMLIMVKLCKRFPNKTIYQFNQDIIGKWMGSLISILMISYFLILAAYEIRVMAETTRLYLLQGTPTWALIMPFMWIGTYLIFGGINAIARMLEIIFPITVIVFLLVMCLGFKIFDLDNLRPVLGMGVIPVLKGLTSTSLSFIGYEIILVIFMFMNEKHKANKVVFIGIGLSLIFYTVTVVMVVGALSPDAVTTQTWPVLTFIQSFEITGLLFERFDSLLLVIWIMQIFSSYIAFYYAAALGLAQLSRKHIHSFYWVVIPIIYIVAMTPENISGLFTLGDWLGKFGFSFFSVIPLLLLMVSLVRGKKHENT